MLVVVVVGVVVVLVGAVANGVGVVAMVVGVVVDVQAPAVVVAVVAVMLQAEPQPPLQEEPQPPRHCVNFTCLKTNCDSRRCGHTSWPPRQWESHSALAALASAGSPSR